MSYQATVYNVMISAPGDVGAECQAARDVIHAWNAAHAAHENKVLLPLDWKRNTVPDAGMPAQKSINKQLVEKTDLLVAIFKHRLGTPTETAPSGSAEEIQEVISAGKPVLLYFSAEAIPQDKEGAQWDALKSFRASCAREKYFHTFASAQIFKDMFKDHLAQKAHDFLGNIDAIRSELNPVLENHSAAVRQPAKLSPLASQILKSTAQGDGRIMQPAELGFFSVYAGRKNFGTDYSDTRKIAKLKGTLVELENEKLITALGSKREIFELTTKGFEVADSLPEMLPEEAIEVLRSAVAGSGQMLKNGSDFVLDQGKTLSGEQAEAALKVLLAQQLIEEESAHVYRVSARGRAYVAELSRGNA